jgi:hypothetical protein
MTIMALILMAYGNKQEKICQPMSRLLSNGEILEVIPPKKNLNNLYVLIVMLCSSSVEDESGNIWSL